MPDLNPMIVSFTADISGLVSSVNQGQSLLADFASQAQDATVQIAALAANANVSDLTVQIDSASSSLTTLSTEVADSSSALQNMGDEAANAASSVQQIGSAADLTGFVSDIDVAQAQLVLLQSKAQDAAASLQEMQAAAAESGDYSGIAEAQAQLVLLQAQAQNAAASLQELQAAESDTSGSTGFGDAISGMMSNLGGFGSAIGDGISSLLGMGSQLGMTVMGLQMLGQQAQQAASALLTPAATAETTTLSFTTLLHSTQAAHQEMVNLNTYAASTPMQTQWVDAAAAKILAFSGTTQQVIPEINSIGDALSGLGKLSEASLNSIVDIFGKISAQGKITGGDMMQLSTWGIPAWNALSEAMGKPIPVLQQMVSKGLIPASAAIPALEKGMENVFGGGMAKQAQTFTGIISTIASDWQIAMASLGGPLLKIAETELTKLSTILASPAFQQFATVIGVEIANVVSNIGAFVKNDVVPAFIQFGTYLGSLAPTASNLFTGIWNGLQVVGNFLRQTFTPVWQELVNVFNTELVPAWENFYNSIVPIMPELETAAKWIGEVLVVAIVGLVQEMAYLIKVAVDVFGGVVEIISGFATYGASYIAMFVDLVTGQWDKLNQDSATAANGLQAIWVGVWNTIEGIFGDAINALIDQVNGWLSQLVSQFNSISSVVHGPTLNFSSIGHVSAMKLAIPATQQASPVQAALSGAATGATAVSTNPFTQFLNSLGSLTAPSSPSTTALTTTIPNAINTAASTTAAATTSSGTKTQAQIQKAADTANAQRLKLAADQQKALQDSSSSAVQQLVNESKQAAAAGDTSTAAFYASQALSLASQQKSAATKTANQKKAAANKAARAKASAAKKAAAAKAKATAASKKKTTTATSRTGTTSRTSTRRTGTTTGSTSSTGKTVSTSTGTSSTSGGTTLTTTTTTPAGTTVTATTTTPAGATSGTPQTLTIILEINGQQFGTAIAPYVMNAATQRVRLKTGLKV